MKYYYQLNNYLLKNVALISYLFLFIILWDTFGMCFDTIGFPFSTFFIVCLLLINILDVYFKREETTKSSKSTLYFVLFIQLLFFVIGNIKSDRNIYMYTILTKHTREFYLIFYIALILFVFSYFIKKQQNHLLMTTYLLTILLMVVNIMCSIKPGIDTYVYITKASNYFLNGKNPYLYQYPDQYNGAFENIYGKVLKYNYWPISFYISSITLVLFGDVRFSFVFFQIIMTILMIKTSKFQITNTILLALFWMFNMMVLYVNERSWVDAYAPMFMFLSYTFYKKKLFKWSSFFLGCLAAIKLYYVLIIPVFLIHSIKNKKYNEVMYIFLGLIVWFLPYVFNSYTELMDCTINFFKNSKIRSESLSIVSALYRTKLLDISNIAIIISILTILLIYLSCLFQKLTYIKIVKLSNVILMIFFLLSKQSFCNYYYFNMFLFLLVIYVENNEKEYLE